MAGRSPRALRHEALLLSCSACPSLPALALGLGAARGGERGPWGSDRSQPENALGISATADIHRLPFREGSTPAHRLVPGLAEWTSCLHRLVREKKKKKRKKESPGPSSKHFAVTLPQSKTHFPSLPKGGGLGLPGPSLGQEGWGRFNRELPWGGRTCAHQRERSRQSNRNRHKSRCAAHRKP